MHFPPYNINFTSIFNISISLGFRPLDPLLSLRPWTPLGDFHPQDTFPIVSIHPPKVTEPLTPLHFRKILWWIYDRKLWQSYDQKFVAI